MIKTVIRSFLIYLLSCSLVFAQTASLLPNGEQQFFDANGHPLSAGSVTFYVPNTSTLATTWKDPLQATPNTNPVLLDAGGRAIIYGNGQYTEQVNDRFGNLIWSQLTNSTGTGGSGGGGTVGDGNLVGTVLPWTGLIAPPNYLFANGQTILRSSYPLFLSTVTSAQAVFCTSGSPTLTGLGDTTQYPIGGAVEASCIPISTVIVSKTATTITLNNNANVSVNTTATFFPFGDGNGVSTFNVPDFRGAVLPGRDNMGGIAKGNLTATFCTSPGLGASCGVQSETLTAGNLPSITPIFTGNLANATSTNTNVLFGGSVTGVINVGSGSPQGNIAIGQSQIANLISNYTPSGSISNNGGLSQAFSVIQPSIQINYIVKVLPDVSTSVATGVASLGGMTGVLACGSGLTCSANTVSVTIGGTAAGSSGQVQFNSSNIFAADPGLTFTNEALTIGINSGTFTGEVILAGRTSGSTGLEAQAIAIGVLLLPSITSDTLVARTTTDTLTNKTFNTSNNTFKWVGAIGPLADSTTAMQVDNTALSTVLMNFDTTNTRVGINTTTPNYTLDVGGNVNVGSILTFSILSPVSLGQSTTSITGLTVNNAPITNADYFLYFSSANGAINSCTIAACVGSSVAGVGSINGQAGSLTIAGVGSVTITSAASTININVPTIMPQGRLTLVQFTPVMITSATNQGTLRYDCDKGGSVPWYTGSSITSADSYDNISGCDVTDAMVATATAGQVITNEVYDSWWVHNGTNHICLAMSASGGGGGGWSNDGGSKTSRGTGYTVLDNHTRPYVTNAHVITNCFNGATNYGSIITNEATYLGTIYSANAGKISWIMGTPASGGNAAILGIYNHYNKRNIGTTVIDSGSSYTYSSATTRQARASAGNQIQFVLGVQEDSPIIINNTSNQVANSIGAQMAVCIGLDTTNACTSTLQNARDTSTTAQPWGLTNQYIAIQPIGLHTASSNEASDGSNTSTFDAQSTNQLSINIRM